MQAECIRALLLGPPINERADLVLDQTGVGAPVADIVAKHGRLRPVRVVITAGSETVQQEYRRYAVPKIVLVSHLDARLHTGELVFADDLSEREAIKGELANFQRHVTAAGRATFEARSSKHDDIVLSVGLALWWALEKRQINRGSVGAVIGLY